MVLECSFPVSRTLLSKMEEGEAAAGGQQAGEESQDGSAAETEAKIHEHTLTERSTSICALRPSFSLDAH